MCIDRTSVRSVYQFVIFFIVKNYAVLAGYYRDKVEIKNDVFLFYVPYSKRKDRFFRFSQISPAPVILKLEYRRN